MNRYVFGIAALVLLAGCATAQPKPEWQMVDGAWVGQATTYQSGSEPGHVTCNDARYEWICGLDANRRAIEDAVRSLKH